MRELGLHEVLVKKRREKGITQEELARYLDVSKASVSKWETGQSLPDIALLPRIAAYFSISVDELLNYRPQLSKKEILALYRKLSEGFAKKPFEEALLFWEREVKTYYSCFPFLVQMASLLLNYCDRAKDPAIRKRALHTVISLCRRVKRETSDMASLRMANSLEAAASLLLGKAEEVLALLKDVNRVPDMGDEGLYASALQMTGETQKAEETLQVCVYRHLIGLLGGLTPYFLLDTVEEPAFLESVRRAVGMVKLFDLENLHPYAALQVYYGAAVGYARRGKKDEVIACLREYQEICTTKLFPLKLHGDQFFSRIDPWLQEISLETKPPREEKSICRALLSAVTEESAFAPYREEPGFRSIQKALAGYLGKELSLG